MDDVPTRSLSSEGERQRFLEDRGRLVERSSPRLKGFSTPNKPESEFTDKLDTIHLDIPTGDFAGYIFDCDGTLVDTMPLHFRAWERALQRAGLPGDLSEELFYSLGGMPTRKVAAKLADHYGLKIDVDKVFHEKEAFFLERLEEAKVIEPVVNFARSLHGRAPMSVASGGPKNVVKKTLELMGLGALFPVIVTPEDVTHGKPSPEMFLLAARLMGVSPERCLVFEDAPPGFQAATAAGMKYVVVKSRPVG